MTRSTRTVQMGGTDSVRLWNPRRSVVATCMTLCVLAASCHGTFATNPRDPLNATDALRLFEASTVAGEALQAQRAMHWIQRNFVSVLQAPELTTLLPECLMQILSQTVSVPEIEVFRAVRRVIESYSSNSTAPGRHQIPRSVLLSTVRFFAIDPSMFRSEVVPSGIVPQKVIVEVLLKFYGTVGYVPVEYERQAFSRACLSPAGSNVLVTGTGARIRPGTKFTLSHGCHGRNPLVSTGVMDTNCWVDSALADWVTVELGNRYLIREVKFGSPSISERRCVGVRLETSADGLHYELGGVNSNFYGSPDTFTLPAAREVSFLRYRVTGHCVLNNNATQRTNTIRVNYMQASYKP